MTLQILAGELKGRRLHVPKTGTTRPTLAIVRKAVFDILQQEVVEATFLDLFAGAGGIGFEALSRGALHVTFVESERSAIRCLQENAALVKKQKECTIMGYDVFLALKKLNSQNKEFDLIYADPPYAPSTQFQFLTKLLSFLDQHPLLKTGGRLFFEEGAPGTFSPDKAEKMTRLSYIDSRRFGSSLLHQFVAL